MSLRYHTEEFSLVRRCLFRGFFILYCLKNNTKGFPLFFVQIADRIRYRLLGYPPADAYFSVNTETGVVSLNGNLTTDSAQTQTYTVNCFFL